MTGSNADHHVDHLRQAASRRSELSAHWPTAAEVGIRMGLPRADASRVMTEQRKHGELLAVYCGAPDHNWRYPSWQFDANHRPVRLFVETLKILRQHGSHSGECGLTSGWDEVEWFVSPHALTDCRPPCELLRDDPMAVFKAAFEEYIADNDSGGF